MPAATLQPPNIGDVFKSVIHQVTNAYIDPANAEAGLQAVDIELNFKSVAISESGWVLFGKTTDQSDMTIRLATRVTPGKK